ncbi:DNA repair exonuclease [Actinopolymorpha sp. B11F2]|uniref:metallophosphoesterase family protein n=1 Tax=Actinopolymorpha sp. B11F2 TaxID=3160862 RepID=UPI0032E3757E
MAITSAMTRPGPQGTPVTFVHTSDWQLGMMRRFLGPEAGARYSQARIDAIERIGAVAREHKAAFVVVAGDVFDANQVDRQVVSRACDALRAIACPVLMVPGNHDSLEPGTVWSSPMLAAHLPSQVEILTDSTPRRPVAGVEVVGVPWRTRRSVSDPLGAVEGWAEVPDAGVVRILVGHGQVESLAASSGDPALIRLEPLQQAIEEGRLHYVALGDRHSLTSVGETGRIWYSGTPEPTRPEEERPGEVLVVEVGPRDACTVTPVSVGTWRLRSNVVDVDVDEGLDELAVWLGAQPDKSRTVVRLGVQGSLTVGGLTRLEMLLEAQEEVYAAIQRWNRHWAVTVLPDDGDLDELPVTGPARAALEELRIATGGGDTQAADALALLHRLAGGVA